ncbi:MAG: alpha/beta fold hydrolase [Pirellulales bacterium]|nr:alpha/beta fold hydrolase [Pirellulales bacterium]
MVHSDWESLYPFQSRWITIDRAPSDAIHYLDEYTGSEGQPETLIFVHGNPTWSFHWRNLVQALRSRYRCVALDHLGCGLSSAPKQRRRLADRVEDLADFLNALDLHHSTLIAQDWGGAIGLGAALADPDLFRRFVLFNTGAFRPWSIPWRIRICRFPCLGRLAVQGGNLFCRAALSMTLARNRLPLAVRRGYLAPYHSWRRREAVYHFVQDIPSNSRHPTWKTLAWIEQNLPSLAQRPILFVWGMRDWCFTPTCLDQFLGIFPSADVVRIADAGHWVVEDAAEESLRAVAAFLEERDLGNGSD